MLAPRLLTPKCLRSAWTRSSEHQLRCLHYSRGPDGRSRARRFRPPKLSLFEELFPEEVKKSSDNGLKVENKVDDVPRLPLPEIEEFFEEFPDDTYRSKARPDQVTNKAAAEAFRQQKLAVLALQVASKSLIESDFRRVAPKGKHIEHWTGPGDILKGM